MNGNTTLMEVERGVQKEGGAAAEVEEVDEQRGGALLKERPNELEDSGEAFEQKEEGGVALEKRHKESNLNEVGATFSPKSGGSGGGGGKGDGGMDGLEEEAKTTAKKAEAASLLELDPKSPNVLEKPDLPGDDQAKATAAAAAQKAEQASPLANWLKLKLADANERLIADYDFHSKTRSFVLYLECQGSLDGRNTLMDNISAQFIDCTGGQAAFEDGDFNKFGLELVDASRKTKFKIYRILRIHDPGVGLDFSDSWVDAGIKAGVFEKFPLPEDVQAEGAGGKEYLYLGHV